MIRRLFFGCGLYCLLAGCGDGGKKNMLPELASCDSAVVMYYHTPNNPRFFNMAKIHDKKTLSLIAKDINGKIMDQKDSCVTQGKIYYYGKSDVVYVAYFNREEDCMLFSFIKTREKYFTTMRSESKAILDKLEKTAEEPPTH